MFKISTHIKYYTSTAKVLFLSFLFLPIFLNADLYLFDSCDIVIVSKDQNSTDGHISVTIQNTKDKDIHIPKRDIDVNNNIFDVKLNDKKVPYIGRTIKRKHTNNINYITLQPEEIYVFEVILSKYYKMSEKGQYSVQYKGNRQLLVKEKFKSIHSTTDNPKILNFIFYPSLSYKYNKTMQKIGNYYQCSQSEIDTIVEANQQALLISENASSSINLTDEFIKSDRYNTWFGTTTNANATIVKTSINNIADTLKNKNINFDCSCSEPYFAYVLPAEPYTIYLCNGFWNAELEGTDSQSGTIIHQLSQFAAVASTQNYSYGKEDTKNLAALYPHYTIYNADSYEYFSENTPYLTMDNIFSTAQSIQVYNNITLENSLQYPNQKDIYKITVGKTAMYSFISSGMLDTEGTLYDKNNFILKFNDDTDFNNLNFSFSAYLIAGGTYYLKVNAYENNLGNYTLNINLNNNLDWLIPIMYLIL